MDKFVPSIIMTLRAIPFLAFAGLYFFGVHIYRGDLTDTHPSVSSAVMKVLPIISLILIVFFTSALDDTHREYRKYILLGLCFSMLGDICLVWKHVLFELGGGLFGIAHLLYIRAFGFKFLRLDVLVVLCVPAVVIGYIQLDFIKGGWFLQLFCMSYMVVIYLMFWRAIGHAMHHINVHSKMALAGAIFFLLSDNILAADMFIKPIPAAAISIMITYYLAQLGFALSVAYYKPSAPEANKQD